MHRAVIISGLLATTLIGAAVLHFAGAQKPISHSNSSIIELRSEGDAFQLREQAQLELDQVEAMFDSAAHPEPDAGMDAIEPDREVQAGAGDNPPSAPVSISDQPVWSELVAYESLRDARLAAAHAPRSRTAVVALPLLPLSSSFSGAGRGAVGIPAVSGLSTETPELDQIRGHIRAGSLSTGRTASGIALVRLAYFALRNGYHGREGADRFKLYPSHHYIAFRYPSRVPASTPSFFFSLSIAKAPAFEISVTGRIRTARDSYTHIGDVA